ncbi:ClpX C4-type zinc finger protein [Klebsiella sp. FDAARGOS_511]|uniref:ClpX C4-type zinc finger protein n=1 Tax=Klebsiella sp. FDAARGOS_511 TaxID=2488567 RepID=UPI001E506FD0|nr:ClpX C4-type zinc finger protein [Klebsiella sp. FDAARGOS_511]
MMANHSNISMWRQMPQREADPKTVCNFCKQVVGEQDLIAGPGVNICSECVDLCNEIIADRRAEYRKKAIEEMATMICVGDQALTVNRAGAIASALFDAGYRKEEV